MRISDWSSDVCSSDLAARVLAVGRDTTELAQEPAQRPPKQFRLAHELDAKTKAQLCRQPPHHIPGGGMRRGEIGRASCRARVCQYVSISVVAVSLKKKKKAITRSRSNEAH